MNDVIDQLEDKERKALLSQIFLRMQVVEEKNGYSDEQFFLDIKNTYNNLLEYKKNQSIIKTGQYHKVHIVFGDSPAGSLKIALKKLGLSHQEKIITFSDLFSIGPIWNLHNLQGISNRSKWFRNHIIIDDEDLYHHEEHFKQTIVDLQQTPNDHPHLDQYIGDHFLEYRVRRLIVDGVFDLEGVPKAMRYYSIKIR